MRGENKMSNTVGWSNDFTVEQVELKGFSRSVAELEWLLLILVLLYYLMPGTEIDDRPAVVAAMVGFAVFVFAFRYLNFYHRETRWKLAIETWVMTAFITWILWNTGKTGSPLLNLYLLVLITSGLTLGKVVTLLEFGLITACYLYMGFSGNGLDLKTAGDFSDLMTKFAPVLLVAYLITMLSADARYARRLLETLSETDELTGLLNLRAFTKILGRESSTAMRYSRAYSVMMIDADGLKQVNDRMGHDAGNRLIRMVATAISDSLRGSDVLARYGGDEFVVLLPETSQRQAREAAERIRTAVANTSFNLDGNRIGSTVSIGIASSPEDSNDPRELLELADRAMYESKQAGRNRCTVSPPRRVAKRDTVQSAESSRM